MIIMCFGQTILESITPTSYIFSFAEQSLQSSSDNYVSGIRLSVCPFVNRGGTN